MPLRRQIIASEIPVLPDVGSRIVLPGSIGLGLGGLDHRARHPVLDRAGRVGPSSFA